MIEWTERLSPILVKELRQGVRGNAFTGAFLILHLLMVVSLLTSLTGYAATGVSPGADVGFWFVIVIPVLLILPLAGGNALSSERTGRTLDLVLLTRLSPRQVVQGKWASLAAQGALLISSVVPYFILRYFMGNVDPQWEVVALFDLLISGALFAGITVSLSALTLQGLFRWILIGATGLLVVNLLQPILFAGAGTLSATPWRTYAAATGLAVLTLLILIEAGALQIAPPAERRPAWLRAFALLALPCGVWADKALPDPAGRLALLWLGLLVGAVAVGSICESGTRAPERGPAPRSRLKRLARAAATLLSPGWASGVLFTTFVLVAVCVLFPQVFTKVHPGAVVGGLLGGFFSPLAVLKSIRPRVVRVFRYYMLLQFISLAVPLVQGIGNTVSSDVLGKVADTAAGLFPLGYLVLAVKGDPTATPWPLTVDIVFGVVSTVATLVVLAKAISELKQGGAES